MHRATIRGFNGKAKHAAVVSPVIDDSDRLEDEDEVAENEIARGYGSEWRPNNGEYQPADLRGEGISIEERTCYQLQQKSAAQETNSTMGFLRMNLGRLFGGHSASNQESDAGSDASAIKFGVLGQKQQWRKHRAQRQRQAHTISSMNYDAEDLDELERAPSDHDESANDWNAALEAVAYSQRSTSSPPASSRSASSTSRRSDALDSSLSSSVSVDRQRYVITRQKRATYSAKLNIPGQKPLYLGRFKSEEAAQAACERASNTILTPRGAVTQ